MNLQTSISLFLWLFVFMLHFLGSSGVLPDFFMIGSRLIFVITALSLIAMVSGAVGLTRSIQQKNLIGIIFGVIANLPVVYFVLTRII